MLRLSIGSVAAVYLWLGFCWMLEGWEGPRRQRRHAAEAGNSGRVLVCVCVPALNRLCGTWWRGIIRFDGAPAVAACRRLGRWRR